MRVLFLQIEYKNKFIEETFGDFVNMFFSKLR